MLTRQPLTRQARSGDDRSTSRVVVGVDGSAGSKRALRWAADYAASTGAELHAVTAWTMPMTVGWAFRPSPEGVPERHAAKVLESTIDEVFGSERPARLRETIVGAHPAAALLEAARDADLLVVGSRGHGGFAATMLGSVGSQCSRHAPCPVAIIRD